MLRFELFLWVRAVGSREKSLVILLRRLDVVQLVLGYGREKKCGRRRWEYVSTNFESTQASGRVLIGRRCEGEVPGGLAKSFFGGPDGGLGDDAGEQRLGLGKALLVDERVAAFVGEDGILRVLCGEGGE